MINHVSASMYGLWAKCEVAFQYRYLEGLKIPGTAAMHGGSALHEACNINHTQKIETQKDMPCSDLQDAARDTFVEKVREAIYIPKEDRGRKNDVLNSALNCAIENVKGYSKEIAPEIQPSASEIKIWGDFGLDLPVLGIIDVVHEKNMLIDFKTTKRKKASGSEHKELQPSFYTMLWKNETGIDANFKYYYLKNGEVDERESSRNKADCDQLLLRLEVFINSVKTGIYKPAEPGHWQCTEKWCGYWPICKFAQK